MSNSFEMDVGNSVWSIQIGEMDLDKIWRGGSLRSKNRQDRPCRLMSQSRAVREDDDSISHSSQASAGMPSVGQAMRTLD